MMTRLSSPLGAVLGALAVCGVLLAAPASGQDTCDVVMNLDAAGPFLGVGWAVDYSATGGDFVGDSSLPGFGPSWGSEFLACTALVPTSEYTAIDDNVGLTSQFVADLANGIVGPAPLVSCVLALPAGFPCPSPPDFSIVDAAFPNDPFPPPPLPPAPAMSITVTARIPVCGDGFVEGIEECDDGNLVDGDCCSAICTLDLAGTPCDDGSVCTSAETCDAVGNCNVGSTLVCDDGVACTHDFCDDVLGCQSAPEPTPSHFCDHVWKGRVDVSDRVDSDATDRVRINLMLADQPLGDPTSTTDYAVCLFDTSAGTTSTPLKLEIPAGAPWTPDRGGFSYTDKTGANEGIRRVQIRPRANGQTRFRLSGKGPSLPLPGPAAPGIYFENDPVVVVQVENSAGACWRENLATPIRNETEKFKAKTD